MTGPERGEAAPQPTMAPRECKETNPHGRLVCRRPRGHAGGHIDTNGQYWQRQVGELVSQDDEDDRLAAAADEALDVLEDARNRLAAAVDEADKALADGHNLGSGAQ